MGMMKLYREQLKAVARSLRKKGFPRPPSLKNWGYPNALFLISRVTFLAKDFLNVSSAKS